MLEPHLRAFQPQLDPAVLSVLGCALPKVVATSWRSDREALVLLDDAGRVIFANAYALDTLSACDLDAARGTDWMQMFRASDRGIAKLALGRAARGMQARFELRPQRAEHPMAFEISPVSTRQGAPKGAAECYIVTARAGMANTNARPTQSPCESG